MYLNVREGRTFLHTIDKEGYPISKEVVLVCGATVGFQVPCGACGKSTEEVIQIGQDSRHTTIVKVGDFICLGCKLVVEIVRKIPESVAFKVKIEHILDLCIPPFLEALIHEVNGVKLKQPVRLYFSLPERSLKKVLKRGLTLDPMFVNHPRRERRGFWPRPSAPWSETSRSSVPASTDPYPGFLHRLLPRRFDGCKIGCSSLVLRGAFTT